MVEYTIYKGDGIDDTMMILGGIKMNKTELVAAVAEQAGLSKKDAEAAIKAFADVVSSALKEGDKVQLVGFPVQSFVGQPYERAHADPRLQEP